MKELLNVKEAAFMDSSIRKAALKGIRRDTDPEMTNCRDYLKVKYFQPTDGLAPEVCIMFNDHFADLKAQYEVKMHIINDHNYELSRTVKFYQQ